VWAQAWSEPDAGSDLAAIRSRAVRCDGGWLVSGTKTWCSRAAFADRAFGPFRTVSRALDFGALACSAQLLGAGRALRGRAGSLRPSPAEDPARGWPSGT